MTPTLRYRLWHTAARIATHGLQTLMRLQADWPWSLALVEAFNRLDRLDRLPAPAT